MPDPKSASGAAKLFSARTCERCKWWKMTRPATRSGECGNRWAWELGKIENPSFDFGCRFWQERESAKEEG